MNEKTKEFIDNIKLPDNWTFEQKCNELATRVLENYTKAGIPDLLPELDYLGGIEAQRNFDREVEQAYSWLVGEIKAYMKEKITV